MGERVTAPRSTHLRRTTVLFVIVAALALAPTALGQVVVSQVYGGGGNSGATYTHDFIELFNRGTTTVGLTGWSVQYASSTGSTWQTTELTGSIAPGGYYLVQQAQGAGGTTALPTPDATGTIAMAAGAGKVALVNSTTALTGACPAGPSIQDFVGFGTANCFEGTGPTPAPSNTNAVHRAGGGCVDTNDNAADFTAAPAAPRNSASPASPCSGPPPNQPVNVTCGSGISTVQGSAASATVTATDPDGRVVDIAITGVTPGPAPGTITRTAFTPASAEGGTASATISVDAAAPPASYSVEITATNDDATPQARSCTLTINVLAVVPIGTVQGSVTDAHDGTTHRSPFAPPSGNSAGQSVAIQGVIYQKTLARTAAGARQNGFFIQNTAATRDDDPTSSDGIFVFMGSFDTLIGGYAPQVGDEVVLTGNVTEFNFLTQLTSARMWRVVRSGVDVDAELPGFTASPPNEVADSDRYWERREGMRARLHDPTLVVAPKLVFASTADAEVFVISGDHPVAQRENPYARRVFRDPHPLDNRPDVLFDDDNGYRFRLGVFGLKATHDDPDLLLPVMRTFDRIHGSPAGGVYFAFAKYTVQVTTLPVTRGVDPSLNAPPTPSNRTTEYSLGNFNVENLYDFRDDPFDGCDFHGNPGCPGVNPPFNYVPESEEAYRRHLAKLAAQVTDDLHSPDILLVQEAEDQDICTVVAELMACGPVNNLDGQPDTLQELALAIRARGGPVYEARADRDGADARGIISAYMFRTDRVERLPATADHPVLGSTPQVEYRSAPLAYNTDVENPKVLNAVLPADVDRSTGTDGTNVFTRAPQVGWFRISPPAGSHRHPVTLYVQNNHFSSGPDRRVGQRREQARYNAAIATALQGGGAAARVFVGGDLNVFPRPDDPYRPGHPLYPTDQLGPLYESGLFNLYDALVTEVPVSAYSYVFDGQAQTLDQSFVSPALRGDYVQYRVAHVNADWEPAEEFGTRAASDHDPSAARFSFSEQLAGLGLSKAASSDATVEGGVITYTLTATNVGPDPATNATLTDRLPGNVTFLSAQASQGTCTGTSEITCSLGELASGASARVVIDVRAGPPGTATNTADLRADQRDPDPSDNTATATTRIEQTPVVPPGPPPPPPDLRCRIDVGPRTLTVGRRATLRVSIRMVASREPAANAVVRLRGAGVARNLRTNAGGTVRVAVRPRRAGTITVRAPELTRCRAGVTVRRARAGVAPALTGRRP